MSDVPATQNSITTVLITTSLPTVLNTLESTAVATKDPHIDDASKLSDSTVLIIAISISATVVIIAALLFYVYRIFKLSTKNIPTKADSSSTLKDLDLEDNKSLPDPNTLSFDRQPVIVQVDHKHSSVLKPVAEEQRYFFTLPKIDHHVALSESIGATKAEPVYCFTTCLDAKPVMSFIFENILQKNVDIKATNSFDPSTSDLSKSNQSVKSDYIKVSIGDTVNVYDHRYDGWCYGVNNNTSAIGLFPIQCIRPVVLPNLHIVHCQAPNLRDQIIGLDLNSLMSYVPDNLSQIKVDRDDVLQTHEIRKNNWCYGVNITKGIIGLYPIECVTQFDNSSAPDQSQDAQLKIIQYVSKVFPGSITFHSLDLQHLDFKAVFQNLKNDDGNVRCLVSGSDHFIEFIESQLNDFIAQSQE
ncbi:hypothetical protein BC833DRAFT_623069 [Globomyces pollinis-pini]|nr:hypothetical protein BC833DRAFT_623069 [Globomyces pollinis-pini]